MMCENCQQREGTMAWVGEGGMLAYTHGFSQHWCERCVVEAQLKYARERAEDIPRLEAKLATLMEPAKPIARRHD